MPYRTTTPGRELLAEIVPEDMRGMVQAPMDRKALNAFFKRLALEHPDEYAEVTGRMADLAAEADTEYGGWASLSLADLKTPPRVRAYRDAVRAELHKVTQDPSLTPQRKNDLVVEIARKHAEPLRRLVLEEGSETGNALAVSTKQGFKGNPVQLAQMLAGDVLITDNRDNPIPMALLHSYSEGLSPLETFVGSYGSRRGYAGVQLATQKTGYFAKQLRLLASGQTVTGEDCGTSRGDELDADDPAVQGRVLAADSGRFKAGTLINADRARQLRGKVQVRSAHTCELPQGICRVCAGQRPDGKWTQVGDFVGFESAGVISEPITQKLALCLDPGTEIRMADWSVKRIADIEPGDRVLGADFDGRTLPVTVLNRWHNGPTDMYRITYRRGSSRKAEISMISSLDHKVWTLSRNHRGKQIHLNGVPRMESAGFDHAFVAALLHREALPEEGRLHVPDAFLLGLLLGDGCYSEAVSVGGRGPVNFSCFDDSLIEYLRTYLPQFGARIKANASKGYWRIVSDKKNGTGKPGVYTNPVKARLASLGMLGLKAHDKRLPVGFHAWDDESLSELLSGLFVSDGCLYKTDDAKTEQYSYSSVSLGLISDIQQVMQLRFGVYSSVIAAQAPTPRHPERVRTIYSITVSGEYSVERLRRILDWRGVKKEKAARISRTEEVNTRAAACAVNYLQLGYRCNRTGIEFVGRYRSMDLEVDHPAHRFVLANGMVVSNSSKHAGGTVGATDNSASGFEEVDQFLQVPETFKGAVHAKADGLVKDISKAPQGGMYVTVGDERHHVPAGVPLLVKPGDDVYEGDPLSEGTLNPRVVAETRGVGEARRYFARTLQDILARNGVPTARSNVDVLARAYLGNVRVTDPDGVAGFRFGEVVPYEDLQRRWRPREGAEELEAKRAAGRYLERPALHYTIGTRVTPAVLKSLAEHGVDRVLAHPAAPGFSAHVVRAAARTVDDPDWKLRMGGFYLKKAFEDMAAHGAADEPRGRSSVFAGIADTTRMPSQGPASGPPAGLAEPLLPEIDK